MNGYIFAVFTVFAVLKMTSIVDFSWWWITSPLWGTFGLALLLGVIAGLVNNMDASKRATGLTKLQAV